MKQQIIHLVVHFDDDATGSPDSWDWQSLLDADVKVDSFGPVTETFCFDCDCIPRLPIDQCGCECHEDLDDDDYEALYEAQQERADDVGIGRLMSQDLW